MRRAPQPNLVVWADCSARLVTYHEDASAISGVLEQTPLVFAAVITAEQQRLCGTGCEFKAAFMTESGKEKLLALGCVVCETMTTEPKFRQAAEDVVTVVRSVWSSHEAATQAVEDAREVGAPNPAIAYQRYLAVVPSPKTLTAIANSRLQTGKPTEVLDVDAKYL